MGEHFGKGGKGKRGASGRACFGQGIVLRACAVSILGSVGCFGRVGLGRVVHVVWSFRSFLPSFFPPCSPSFPPCLHSHLPPLPLLFAGCSRRCLRLGFPSVVCFFFATVLCRRLSACRTLRPHLGPSSKACRTLRPHLGPPSWACRTLRPVWGQQHSQTPFRSPFLGLQDPDPI